MHLLLFLAELQREYNNADNLILKAVGGKKVRPGRTHSTCSCDTPRVYRRACACALQDTCSNESINNDIQFIGRAKGQRTTVSKYAAGTEKGILHYNRVAMMRAVRDYPDVLTKHTISDPTTYMWAYRVLRRMSVEPTAQLVDSMATEMRTAVATSEAAKGIQSRIKRAEYKKRARQQSCRLVKTDSRVQYGEGGAVSDDSGDDSNASNARERRAGAGSGAPRKQPSAATSGDASLPAEYRLVMLHVQRQGYDEVCDGITQLAASVIHVCDGAASAIVCECEDGPHEMQFTTYCASLPVNRDVSANRNVSDDRLRAAGSEKHVITQLLTHLHGAVHCGRGVHAGVLAQPDECPCVIITRQSSTNAFGTLHRAGGRAGVDVSRALAKLNIAACVEVVVNVDDSDSEPDDDAEVHDSTYEDLPSRSTTVPAFKKLHAAVAARLGASTSPAPAATASLPPQDDGHAAVTTLSTMLDSLEAAVSRKRKLASMLAAVPAHSWRSIEVRTNAATKKHGDATGGVSHVNYPRCGHGTMRHGDAPHACVVGGASAGDDDDGGGDNSEQRSMYSLDFTCYAGCATCPSKSVPVDAAWRPRGTGARRGRPSTSAAAAAVPSSRKRLRSAKELGRCGCGGKCVIACPCSRARVRCTAACHSAGRGRKAACTNSADDNGRGGDDDDDGVGGGGGDDDDDDDDGESDGGDEVAGAEAAAGAGTGGGRWDSDDDDDGSDCEEDHQRHRATKRSPFDASEADTGDTEDEVDDAAALHLAVLQSCQQADRDERAARRTSH
jgi:hypothetical protein